MREAALPPQWACLTGKVLFVQQHSPTEWSSTCPECGGDVHPSGEWPDRCRLFVDEQKLHSQTRYAIMRASLQDTPACVLFLPCDFTPPYIGISGKAWGFSLTRRVATRAACLGETSDKFQALPFPGMNRRLKMLKQCSKCGQIKPLHDFYRNTGSPDGFRPDCKACERKPHATQAEKFWRYVDKRSDNECWEWTRTLSNKGYGRFWINNKHVLAHRYAYEQTNGHIPNGMEVCHKCDNPKCVNPAHLFLGTHTDNMRDAKAKGRTAVPSPMGRFAPRRGADNPATKLSGQAVKEIRDAYAEGRGSYMALAQRYGVCGSTIANIIKGRTWRHLR